jgi:hypothetical protein
MLGHLFLGSFQGPRDAPGMHFSNENNYVNVYFFCICVAVPQANLHRQAFVFHLPLHGWQPLHESSDVRI